MFNSIIVDRYAPLRSTLAAVALAVVVLSWGAFCKESELRMASIFGDHGLSGAPGAGMAESNRQNAERNQGNKDARGGGRTPEGVPINPAQPRKLPSIPPIEDHDGGATPPTPLDLTLIPGPQDMPRRKPLHNASVSVPETGVTGYAGVFIP
jgi:hypothetical protein